ncbi:large conductance mechanosensitive channel protein MscL, partial [Tyzzerella sp. OttesenSCG-928-J15]|nr:large conductance mechanosensitive channel protein MscL [Tyzzerella sp. OttesenSCG-928-J15]
MKKFLLEFKDFASRGNAMNLAVGVIIGAAFQAIVTSLTTDIISPLLSLFVSKQNFENLVFEIFDTTIYYGLFINSVINFIITAFVIFVLVKALNKLNKKEEAPPALPSRKCPYCKGDVHDEATRC